MPLSVSSTNSDAKTANFKPYLIRDGLRFRSKSKEKLSSDAWKGEESPRLWNLNALSLTTDKMAKKVKKGVFQKFCCAACFARPDVEIFLSIFCHHKAESLQINLTKTIFGTYGIASSLKPPHLLGIFALLGEKWSVFKFRWFLPLSEGTCVRVLDLKNFVNKWSVFVQNMKWTPLMVN